MSAKRKKPKHLKITFSEGDWLLYFKDRETHEKLSKELHLTCHGMVEIDVPVPYDLVDNKNAMLYFERIR
jgi:hypothetical protein